MLIVEREFCEYKSVLEWDDETNAEDGGETGRGLVCVCDLSVFGVPDILVGLVVLTESLFCEMASQYDLYMSVVW